MRVLNPYLTFVLLDIINRYDFIDYGILVSHTQVFFDEENFEIVVVSPYYFQYVNRDGQLLQNDFMTDDRFTLFIENEYKKALERSFTKALTNGKAFNFIPPAPTLVIVETMDYEELKERRRGLDGRHSD